MLIMLNRGCDWMRLLLVVALCLLALLHLTVAIPPMHEMLSSSSKQNTDTVGMMSLMLSTLTKGWPDPPPHQMNRTALLERLGRNFDEDYMAITSPVGDRHRDLRNLQQKLGDGSLEMPRSLHSMRFAVKHNDVGRSRFLGDKASSKLRVWLWELSRCAVNHRWLDLGPKFFPRYIKDGSCPKRSCSYPEGMYCQTESARSLRLLIWLCSSRNGTRCRWGSFLTETITKCKCQCNSSSR